MPILPIAMAAAPILGKLFGGGAQGAAQERAGQNQFTLNKNTQELSKYGTQQNALLSALLARGRENQDRYQTQQGATTNAMQGQHGALVAGSNEGLQRAQLGLQAPTARARQSVLGSVMKNLQPSSFSVPEGQKGRVPTRTGGLTAAVLDPTTRAHGDELMNAALMAQLSGSDVPKATDFKAGDWAGSVIAPPPTTDYMSGILAPPELGGYKTAGKGESILSGLGVGGGVLGEILKLIQGAQGDPNAPDPAMGG